MQPLDPRQAAQAAWATPWKASTEISRIVWLPWIRLYFAAHGVRWRSGWRIYGAPTIQRHRGSRISIGEGFENRNWRRASPLGVWHPTILTTWTPQAVLEIGGGVGLTGGVICAAARVQIGDRVTIGANCTILDTDFHPLQAGPRGSSPAAGAAAEVVLEDDVFLGTQALILKGSHIGRGSVIGAGSVVAGVIPPGVVAAGNPARVLREL
jgi:hypothetical protein